MDIKRNNYLHPTEFLACAAFRYILHYPKRIYLKQIVDRVYVSETTLNRITQGKARLTLHILHRTLDHIGMSMEDFGRLLDDIYRFNNEKQLITSRLDHENDPRAIQTFIVQYVNELNNRK